MKGSIKCQDLNQELQYNKTQNIDEINQEYQMSLMTPTVLDKRKAIKINGKSVSGQRRTDNFYQKQMKTKDIVHKNNYYLPISKNVNLINYNSNNYQSQQQNLQSSSRNQSQASLNIDQEFKYHQMKNQRKEEYQLNSKNLENTKIFLQSYILQLEKEIKFQNQNCDYLKKEEIYQKLYHNAQSKQQSEKFLSGRSQNSKSQTKRENYNINKQNSQKSISDQKSLDRKSNINSVSNNQSEVLTKPHNYLLQKEQLYDKYQLVENLSIFMKYMDYLESNDVKLSKVIQHQEKLIEFYSISNKKKEDQLKLCNQEIIRLKNELDRSQSQRQIDQENNKVRKLQTGNLNKTAIYYENQQQSDRNLYQSKLSNLQFKKSHLKTQPSHDQVDLLKSQIQYNKRNSLSEVNSLLHLNQQQSRKSLQLPHEHLKKNDKIQSSLVSIENDTNDDQQQFFINHSNEFSNFQVLLTSAGDEKNLKQQFFEQKNLKIIKNHFQDPPTVLQHMENLRQDQLQIFAQQISYNFQSLEMSIDIILKLKQIIYAVSNMHNSFSIQDAFLNIINETCKILSCDRASVYLIDPKREQLWTKVAKGVNTIYVPFGKGFVGSVVETKKIVNVIDAKKDKRFNPEIDRKSGYSTQSVLCTPIYDKNNQEIIGVLQAINKLNYSKQKTKQVEFFTKDDEGIIQILAQISSSVIRNSLYYDERLAFHNFLRVLLYSGLKLNAQKNFCDLQFIAESILIKNFDAQKAKLYFYNYKQQIFFRHDDETKEKKEFKKNLGFVGKCFKERQVLNIQNSNNHVEQNLIVDIETDLPIVCIPIKADENTRNLLENGEDIIGVMEFINPKGIDTLLYNKSQNLQSGQIFFESIKNFADMLASNITNIYYQENQEQKALQRFQTMNQNNEVNEQINK